MFFKRKSFFIALAAFCILFFVQQPVQARKQFTGFSFKGNPTAYKSNNKTFTAGFALIGGQGKMGNDLADAPSRDLFFMPIQVFMGFRFGKFRLCAEAEYMQVSQSTDAAEVANTNTSGSGVAYGPRLDYYDGKQSFGVFYRTSDTYRLDKPDINNVNQEYKASSGYTLQYTRRLFGRLGIVLDYSQEEFTQSLTTANIKWNRAGIGIIFSNFDMLK